MKSRKRASVVKVLTPLKPLLMVLFLFVCCKTGKGSGGDGPAGVNGVDLKGGVICDTEVGEVAPSE